MLELAASVIVCTRNRAEYLNETLESLSRQNCRERFEVVIVDNGSADDTPQVIQTWCRRHCHFRSVRENRTGLSAAKNAGAQSALGRLLLFTDDDVLVDHQWVHSYLDLFARIGESNTIIGGPIVPILHDLRPWPEWFDLAALPEAGLLDYKSERQLLSWEYVWGANMGIPSSLFRTIGPWDEELGRKGEHRGTFEDTDYQDRLRAIGGTVWFCPKASLQHRVERERIAPPRVMSQAFGRGRNDFLRHLLRTRGTFQNPTRETALLRLMAALVVNLARWIGSTLAFSLLKNRMTFRAAHAAAFSAGNLLERTRAGREGDALMAGTVKTVLFVRRVALILTPKCGVSGTRQLI
jgi:glucosyl-dolichyl phosphate glucuronosyltransferase